MRTCLQWVSCIAMVQDLKDHSFLFWNGCCRYAYNCKTQRGVLRQPMYLGLGIHI